jgi:hypothetical protein
VSAHRAGREASWEHPVSPTPHRERVRLTAGTNPHSTDNAFTQKRVESFDLAHGWPDKVATFTVAVRDPDLVEGHLLKYVATLVSPNQITSFVKSPVFLLHFQGPSRWSTRG